MSLPSILYSLASIPMFAARPFLAAFFTAFLARFGHDIPWLRDSDVIHALHRAPEWFQSNWTLFVLGVLALGEVLSAKHSEVRSLMQELDGWLKSGVALLVSLAVLDAKDAETIKAIQHQGVVFGSIGAIGVAVLTYGAAALRRGALWIVHEIDEHDHLGLQTLLSWTENAWTISGLLFLVVFPVVALVLSACTALALWQIRRWYLKREEQQKIPCRNCNTPIRPHALRCYSCGTPVAEPRDVGVFGQPKATPAPDLARHRFALEARKRCPSCASRLTARAVQQACTTCKTVTFASWSEFEAYLDELGSRLPRTLLVSFLLSAIPVVGVIPGVIYYNLSIVTGLRGYIPPVQGCLARVVVRIVSFFIIMLQPIPILGAFVVPIMCGCTYTIYRSSLKGRARRELSSSVQQAA